ncbi:bifunctional RNA recognition motif domain/RNA-binding domain superfamily/Nucleotide-binding alpha-beta plait domain superfamily/RNA recognition motif domain [Babesia duncani]|uniref:Bifunctional RNA recognition motif domain/RNA-binding domain superfamily/Nucleotide-binding alpha-beta plait domain superfamily/RNA recognition motif domain n=1 Tax=Babesia duncani TaxID=323732 RepID=A0AAD9PPC6_9APIC|nr:bifunctional RNA recognition motif domain/RNA-binding domain superfamily/Nucleotide-binding alpha-beta plait domain superfamily/RNA recognition motif domain [Babesia duncani]
MNQNSKCRVYVGNLSWKVRWQDLKDHMRQAGEVVRANIIEDFEGKSKGCGIVEFANEEDAAKAIAELNDTMIFDRPIFVREDREENSQTYPRNPRRYNRDGNAMAANKEGEGVTLIVSNLEYNTSWQNLKDLFKTCGPVARVDIMMHDDGRSKGLAKVVFTNEHAAKKAVAKFNDYLLGGRKLGVRFAG